MLFGKRELLCDNQRCDWAVAAGVADQLGGLGDVFRFAGEAEVVLVERMQRLALVLSESQGLTGDELSSARSKTSPGYEASVSLCFWHQVVPDVDINFKNCIENPIECRVDHFPDVILTIDGQGGVHELLW